MKGTAALWAGEELSSLEARGLFRRLEPMEWRGGARVGVGGRELVSFCSNDYLGLRGDPRLSLAAQQGLEGGVGAGASRLVSGDTPAHHSLERRLAQLLGAEAALVFGSGYAANLGAISSLVGPGDLVLSDELNHASIIDGCRLSRAQVQVYPHGDLTAVDRLLGSLSARRKLLVTEAVFSMDGDLAPLPGLLEVCRRHRAALMVDEAHAIGVLGPRGAGLCEELGLSAEVDLRVGTLGKALGVFGAFVAGAAEVRELLVNRARSFIYSTALPPHLCAAAERAVELAAREPQLRAQLWRNIWRLAKALGRPTPRSAILPLLRGSPQAALGAAEKLRQRGLLVKAIRPPTVPEGTSRLRLTLSAAHTQAELDRLVEALRELELPHER